MDLHVMSRRQLLQALGSAGVAAPFAAAFGSSTAFAQGACRDGFGTGALSARRWRRRPRRSRRVFEPTGWKTVSLDHITFRVADYQKEAAFYIALMGWTLRSDDGKQAVLDIGDWGGDLQAGGAGRIRDAAAGAAARRRRPGAVVESFCFAIDRGTRRRSRRSSGSAG